MTHIGDKLRQMRQSQGLTLPGLATAAGITKGYLSKIERTSKPPAFSTLQALASALNADIGELLATERAPAASPNLDIHGPNEGVWQTAHKLGGYDFLPLLKSYRNKYLSPFLMRVPPGTTSYFKHDGEEFLHVMRGRVELHYEGRIQELAQGASAYLDSRIRHRFRNRGKTTALILAVNFVYRRF